MPSNDEVVLTAKDVATTFLDPTLIAKYPPVLTVDQAADLLQVPKPTIYDWSSRGRLKSCARKVGKHLRIHRDKLILLAFNQGINK